MGTALTVYRSSEENIQTLSSHYNRVFENINGKHIEDNRYVSPDQHIQHGQYVLYVNDGNEISACARIPVEAFDFGKKWDALFAFLTGKSLTGWMKDGNNKNGSIDNLSIQNIQNLKESQIPVIAHLFFGDFPMVGDDESTIARYIQHDRVSMLSKELNHYDVDEIARGYNDNTEIYASNVCFTGDMVYFYATMARDFKSFISIAAFEKQAIAIIAS